MLCVLISIASNDCTQHTVFNIKKKITLNHPKSAAMGFFVRDSRTSSKQSVVNEPSVVVALLFYVHGKHLRSCRDGQLT